MKKRIAFIGGVHGVGKTVFCTKLCSGSTFDHVTASSLIHRKKQIDLKTKEVTSIDQNQLILIEELSSFKTDKNIILLDGHFCLLDSASKIQEVPIALFNSISPFAIVILTDKPSSIAGRLSNRDDREYGNELITTFQEREINWACSVATAINIPIKIVNMACDIEKLIIEIGQFLNIAGNECEQPTKKCTGPGYSAQ